MATGQKELLLRVRHLAVIQYTVMATLFTYWHLLPIQYTIRYRYRYRPASCQEMNTGWSYSTQSNDYTLATTVAMADTGQQQLLSRDRHSVIIQHRTVTPLFTIFTCCQLLPLQFTRDGDKGQQELLSRDQHSVIIHTQSNDYTIYTTAITATTWQQLYRQKWYTFYASDIVTLFMHVLWQPLLYYKWHAAPCPKKLQFMI